MKQEEYELKNKEGKVEEVKSEVTIEPKPLSSSPQQGSPISHSVDVSVGDEYVAVLENIKAPRRHLSVAPTFIPRNFADQIQFFDDGVNRRLYIYVNNTWRYVTLT